MSSTTRREERGGAPGVHKSAAEDIPTDTLAGSLGDEVDVEADAKTDSTNSMINRRSSHESVENDDADGTVTENDETESDPLLVKNRRKNDRKSENPKKSEKASATKSKELVEVHQPGNGGVTSMMYLCAVMTGIGNNAGFGVLVSAAQSLGKNFQAENAAPLVMAAAGIACVLASFSNTFFFGRTTLYFRLCVQVMIQATAYLLIAVAAWVLSPGEELVRVI